MLIFFFEKGRGFELIINTFLYFFKKLREDEFFEFGVVVVGEKEEGRVSRVFVGRGEGWRFGYRCR